MPEIDIATYRDKLLLTDICLYASKVKNVWKVGSIGGHPNQIKSVYTFPFISLNSQLPRKQA